MFRTKCKVNWCKVNCCKIIMFLSRVIWWFLKKLFKCSVSLWFSIIIVVTVLWNIRLYYYRISIVELKMPYVETIPHTPSIVWWSGSSLIPKKTIDCPENTQCDVYSRDYRIPNQAQAYIFYASQINFDDLPLPRKPQEVFWGLLHEESPRNVLELLHDPILELFNVSSTFSRYSDVPFPLQYMQSLDDITSLTYFVKTPLKNKYLKDIAPVLYIQSDCDTSTERDDYVKELMKYVAVDSYGTCLNNKEMPKKFTHDYLNHLNDDDFLKFVGRYKFIISIENGVCEDYITEKFWRAIKVGSIPIYFGSPSIKDWLPNSNSALLLEDFRTPQRMADQINVLNKDDELYEAYLEHKTKQLISNTNLVKEINERPYQLDIFETTEKFECFVCQKIHEGLDKVNIITKKHYNCPTPISALYLDVNRGSNWVNSWSYYESRVQQILQNISSYS